jgi:hypothetical protein
MKTNQALRLTGIPFFFLLGLVSIVFPACCPTGAWEDNFGRFYSLVTLAPTEEDQPFLTTGQADTRDLGCGVWNVRPPRPGEPAVDPENPVAFVVENPNPNPADLCCYAFRFDGSITGGGCLLIIGEYENVGGKCEQSGQMFLASSL